VAVWAATDEAAGDEFFDGGFEGGDDALGRLREARARPPEFWDARQFVEDGGR
jgi:hypothetical protein